MHIQYTSHSGRGPRAYLREGATNWSLSPTTLQNSHLHMPGGRSSAGRAGLEWGAPEGGGGVPSKSQSTGNDGCGFVVM